MPPQLLPQPLPLPLEAEYSGAASGSLASAAGTPAAKGAAMALEGASGRGATPRARAPTAREAGVCSSCSPGAVVACSGAQLVGEHAVEPCWLLQAGERLAAAVSAACRLLLSAAACQSIRQLEAGGRPT